MKLRFRHLGSALIPSRPTLGRLALCLALMAVTVGFATRAEARSAGFASEQCGGCHRGANVPKITIAPSSNTPALGSTMRLTVTIDVGSARGSGFYLGSTSGKLMPVPGEKTKEGGEGVTHNGTNSATGGKVVFHADWVVPATPGGVDFHAAAIAANMDGGSGGDGSSSMFLPFAYGCSGGTTYYRDFDGDGIGYSDEVFTRSCGKPEGYGETFGDCDDNDPKIKPGAVEICNRRDDNCDGKTDEGLESLMMYPDVDGDGWGRRTATGETKMGCGSERGWGQGGTDCDDNDKAVFPDAPEICNLKDDDCDGRMDEGARAECGIGWCRRLAVGCDGASCTPGKAQKERCNLLDDDCDGDVDEDPDALCEAGLTCRVGRCVDSETAPPVATGGVGGTGEGGSTGAGGSAEEPADAASSSRGCSFLPRPHGKTPFGVCVLLASLCAGIWRKRSRRLRG